MTATSTSRPRALRAARPVRSGSRREWLLALALLLPNVVLLAVFTYRPMFDNIRLSFTSWNIASPVAEPIGWANYVEWFTSEDSRQVLVNTVISTGFAIQLADETRKVYERDIEPKL